MHIKAKIISTEDFQSFRKVETESAIKNISETIREFEKNGCTVKVLCTDIDNEALVVERTPLSYNGLIPSIIETISNKKKNNNSIRTEIKEKICVLELRIKAELINGKRVERIIRYFVFRYKCSKDKYIVKYCNNKIYTICVSVLLKNLNANNKEYAFKEHLNLLLLRCWFPSRFGKQAYMYNEKEYMSAYYICFFIVFMLILILIWLLPIVFNQKG